MSDMQNYVQATRLFYLQLMLAASLLALLAFSLGKFAWMVSCGAVVLSIVAMFEFERYANRSTPHRATELFSGIGGKGLLEVRKGLYLGYFEFFGYATVFSGIALTFYGLEPQDIEAVSRTSIQVILAFVLTPLVAHLFIEWHLKKFKNKYVSSQKPHIVTEDNL